MSTAEATQQAFCKYFSLTNNYISQTSNLEARRPQTEVKRRFKVKQ